MTRNETLRSLKRDLDDSIEEMCRVACGALMLYDDGRIYIRATDRIFNEGLLMTMHQRDFLNVTLRPGMGRRYTLTEKGREAAQEDPLVRSTLMQERL